MSDQDLAAQLRAHLKDRWLIHQNPKLGVHLEEAASRLDSLTTALAAAQQEKAQGGYVRGEPYTVEQQLHDQKQRNKDLERRIRKELEPELSTCRQALAAEKHELAVAIAQLWGLSTTSSEPTR